MTLKSLKTLLAAGLVCGLFSAPALAEDAEVSSDNKYDLAYNKCSDVADNQESYESWDGVFNNCMRQEGFEPETEVETETEQQ
ncbi:MAG: hypothetical protein PQ612_10085 [Rickettsiales bacterium]|nr:hypothetical protein [Pseudomonadota bacterium]MDA0967599.1 hypothetical protein [Pseudomonadota bacterium]MDG4544372.1 hypothetical protein [Rickettsiales bacterium]MDG4546502.1 hypothetical protein [Rickettsiales bacterium]MDG4548662.1 hypothetical protein [Rickettsiales bacterium]